MRIALISVSNLMQVHDGRNELLGVFHLGNKKHETLSLQWYLAVLCEGRATLPPSPYKSSQLLIWMNRVLWSEMVISNPRAMAANTFYIVIHKGMPLNMSSHFSSIVILISHPNDFSPETWEGRTDRQTLLTHASASSYHKAILGKKGWSPSAGFLALFQKVH